MFIPREFAVNDAIWRVEYKWNLTHNKSRVDGLTDPVEKIVYLDRALTPEEKFSVFIHEFIHVVFTEYKLGFNAERLDYDHEEEIALEIERVLMKNFSMKWRKKR